MQSQCSQDSSFSGPLSLSLSKFSHATVPEDSSSPIPWIHLSSKGHLFAVFEKCRSWDHQGQLHDQNRFRVTNGAEILEDLNLIALAAEARKAIGRNQVSNILNRPSAVTIIVKKPCIAVRYPSGLGQIRRFQIRFPHDADYYAAMGRLSEANAPVTEAGTFPTPQPQTRPFSSSSSVLYPSDSASQLDAQPPPTRPVFPSDERGSTSASSILNGAEGFLRPGTSSSSIMQASTPTHRIPHTISSGSHDQQSLRDICALPQDPPETSSVRLQHGATTSHYWNDDHRSMQTSNQPYVEHLASHRPMSSTACSAPATRLSHPPIDLYEPRPSTAPMIESQRLSEMLPPKRDLPFAKPILRSGANASKNTKYMAEIALSALAQKENNKIPVASSQPSDRQELETQSGPSTAKSNRAPAKKASARVTKKLAAPRSRKKAASVREANPVPSVEELLNRSQDSAKGVIKISKTIDTQALLARVEERQAVAICQNPISKHNSAPSFAQEATAPAHQDPTEASLASVRPTRGDQATELSLLEGPGPQVKIFTSVAELYGSQEGHHSLCQAVPTSGQGNPPDFPAGAPNPPPVRQALSEQRQNIAPMACDPSVQPLANRLTVPLASNLAEWAKGPEEERRASLETFICRSIKDENFFKLCKDLDGTWQRVFLGKIV